MPVFPPYPRGLLPRGGRRGGMTFFRMVYLGSHPVAALVAVVITLYLWAIVLAWAALVTLGWLLWALVTLPARAFRR